jgi:hypothetical protein
VKHAAGRAPAVDRHRGLAIFAGINAVAAWGGAIGLATGALSITPQLEQRLPFASPVLGGLALGTFVAVPLSVLAWCAATGHRRTTSIAAGVGTLLIGWIVVQVLFLRSFSPFQPTYLAIGAGLIVWSRRRTPLRERRRPRR